MTTPCYLFDIDGTLADCSHRLHHIVRTDGRPKDWDSFFAAAMDDALIRPVALVLGAVRAGGDAVVFSTGRGEEYREVTEAWLAQNVGARGPLYMRPAGDRRDDDIVKAELLDRVMADGHRPIAAFEDRTRVVKMYRRRGLCCVQVSEGDF